MNRFRKRSYVSLTVKQNYCGKLNNILASISFLCLSESGIGEIITQDCCSHADASTPIYLSFLVKSENALSSEQTWWSVNEYVSWMYWALFPEQVISVFFWYASSCSLLQNSIHFQGNCLNLNAAQYKLHVKSTMLFM